MAENVAQVLESHSKTLLDKLSTNPDLCNIVLALLGRCIIECSHKGYPIEGIRLGELMIDEFDNGDLIIAAQVTFHHLALTTSASWPHQSDFAVYTRAKANGLGLALQKNPRLNEFFQKLIEVVDKYADRRNVQFGAVIVKQSILTASNLLILKVGRKLLDA